MSAAKRTANLSGSRSSSSVFLGAKVLLYDAGVRAARVTQAQADVDNANVMLFRRQNEAVRRIVLADNALRTSLSAYSASGDLSKAAQTTFDAALASYRNRRRIDHRPQHRKHAAIAGQERVLRRLQYGAVGGGLVGTRYWCPWRGGNDLGGVLPARAVWRS